MADTGLYGPYALTTEQTNAHVGHGIGAYALGKLDTAVNTFYVYYVGRSDDDLNGRLHKWVRHYTHFQYGFLDTVRAAFDKECRLYHDFGGKNLANKVHPARPPSADWPCPVVGCDELN